MKIQITETAWGINRATGSKSEKVTAVETFPCEVGNLPEIGKSSRRFSVDAVNEASAVISVHCADSRYDKIWNVHKGEDFIYRPRSFDGGYYYKIKLI